MGLDLASQIGEDFGKKLAAVKGALQKSQVARPSPGVVEQTSKQYLMHLAIAKFETVLAKNRLNPSVDC